MKLLSLFILISFFIVSDSKAQLTSSDKGELSDKTFKEVNENHFVQYLGTTQANDSTFSINHFVFFIRDGEYNGGRGFEIIRNSTNTPVWMTMPYGDSPPRNISISDFNNDSIPDLMFLMGFEDMYRTKLYLGKNNIYKPNTEYSSNNFELIYENKNDYLIILDIDKNGTPEFLDSGYKGNVNLSSYLCSEHPDPYGMGPSIKLNDAIIEEIKSVYNDITNDFDHLNFDYNMPDRYQVYNMLLLSPVKILAFEGEDLTDVSSKFKDHIQWRIDILERSRSISIEECYPKIDNILSHLNELIH